MAQEIDETLSDSCFAEFLQLTYALTGITIAETRRSMLISRLRKRLLANSLTRFEDYLSVVRKDPCEARHFVDSMTTNETYFFRTPRIWTYLEDEFISEWSARNPGRTLRLWSAAASTGEEAHTAGVLLEDIRERGTGFDYKVLGTDISPRVIGVAQKGQYSGRAIERFREARPDLFDRYLQGTEMAGYSVLASIRDRLKFETHNLFAPAPPGKGFDIVLLRNVLIYFSKLDQERVLASVQLAMDPNGVLIIGESESLSSLSTGFKPVAPFVYRPSASPFREAA